MQWRRSVVQEKNSGSAEFYSVMAERMSSTPLPSEASVRQEMASLIRGVAACRRGEAGMKRALEWAARKCGLTYGQAKRLAYEEMATVPAHIADRVRETAGSVLAEQRLAAQQAHIAFQQERARRLRLELAALEQRLGGTHEISTAERPRNRLDVDGDGSGERRGLVPRARKPSRRQSPGIAEGHARVA